MRMNHKITQAACESFRLTATIMRIIVPTQNTMNGCGITCTIARSPPPAAKVIGPPRKLFVHFETARCLSLLWDSGGHYGTLVGPLRRGKALTCRSSPGPKRKQKGFVSISRASPASMGMWLSVRCSMQPVLNVSGPPSRGIVRSLQPVAAEDRQSGRP